jgi:hypothetical protein
MYSQVFSQKENNCLFVFVATLFIKQCYLPFLFRLCHESYLMLAGIYIQQYSPQQSLLRIEYSVYTMRMLYSINHHHKNISVHVHFCTVRIRIFVEKRNLQEGLSLRLVT